MAVFTTQPTVRSAGRRDDPHRRATAARPPIGHCGSGARGSGGHARRGTKAGQSRRPQSWSRNPPDSAARYAARRPVVASERPGVSRFHESGLAAPDEADRPGTRGFHRAGLRPLRRPDQLCADLALLGGVGMADDRPASPETRLPREAGSRRVCPALGLRRSRGRSRPIDVCLPCIREIAVILADVRHDQRLDEVEKRAGGD